jgi:hypothetical protein
MIALFTNSFPHERTAEQKDFAGGRMKNREF